MSLVREHDSLLNDLKLSVEVDDKEVIDKAIDKAISVLCICVFSLNTGGKFPCRKENKLISISTSIIA